MDFIAPCFGIGHNLSLICQMTSEDIKHQLIKVLCLFDPQGCAQCHSLSKSRSLWLQRAPLSQGESGQIGRLFCEALEYKIKQHGKSAPKVDVHYKDFFFFDGQDILSIASECCGVVWNTYTQARARTHTHIHARACIR